MNLKSIIAFTAVILLITCLTYRKAVHVPYIYDDKEIILRDGAFESDGFLEDLFSKNYYDRFGERTYRPVATASFMIDKALWNLSPVGTHIFNVLIHATIAIVVFFLLIQFNVSLFWSMWGALLFAIHPVKIEAVALASNREELLCGLFFFASLLSYLKRTETGKTASWCFFALAIFCKEMAASLPIVVAAYEFYFSRDEKSFIKSIKKSVAPAAPFVVITCAFLFLKFTLLSNPVGNALLPGGSPTSALMIMSSVFMKYCALLLYPVSMCADYVASPSGFMPVAGLLFFILLAAVLWKYGKTAGFTFAFFLAALLPVSNIYPFGETMAERYLYIPSFALSLGLAKLFDSWDARIFKIIPAIFIIFFLGYKTDQRLNAWQSESSYWEDAVACAPDSSEAWTNLGNIQLRNDDPALALAMYDKAINCSSFVPEDKYFYNKGLALYQLGRIDDAKSSFIVSVNLAPHPALPYYQLSKIAAQEGFPFRGLKYLESAINSDPDNHLSYYILSQYYLNTFKTVNSPDNAVSAISKAIDLAPGNPLYHAALANALIAKGDLNAAEKAVGDALRIQPGFTPARAMLKTIIEKKKQTQ